MSGFLLLVSFGLAVVMGATAASLLSLIRPSWGNRRRLIVSALVLPALALAATIFLLLAVLLGTPQGGGDMRDLALAATAQLGGAVALLAFAGSFVGAWLRNRGMRK